MRRCRGAFALIPFLVVAACLAGQASAQAAAAAPKKPVDQYYVMTVQELGKDTWRLSVVNTNPGAKFIGTFWWIPPIGMTIQSVKRVNGGTCSLGGNAVTCKGNVAPPNCFTCVGDSMTLDFTATGDEPKFVNTSYGGYYIHYGVLGQLNVTSLNSFGDLPTCAAGKKSTPANPCAPAGT